MNEEREDVSRFLRDRTDDAFVALYRRHTPVLYGLAMRLSGSAVEAEDVVQDVWIRAVAALPRFQWQSALRTWLCGFVVNCCRERRRLRPQPEAVRDVMPERLDQRMDLERAVAALPPGYREVVVLHDVYGHTHQEIGEMLEIEEGTSKSQLHHGRAALRALLGGGETP